jgi:hypothetical protein
MKLADIPSCLGGEDNGINGKYFGVDHQHVHLAFQLTALCRFESYPYSIRFFFHVIDLMKYNPRNGTYHFRGFFLFMSHGDFCFGFFSHRAHRVHRVFFFQSILNGKTLCTL